MPLTPFHYDALLPSSLPYPSLSQRFYTSLSCPSLSATSTGMPFSHHHCHTLLLQLRFSTSLWCPSLSSTITGMPSVHCQYNALHYHYDSTHHNHAPHYLLLSLGRLSSIITTISFYYHYDSPRHHDALHYVYVLLSLGCPLSIVNTMPFTITMILHINMMPFTIFYYTNNALRPSLWHLAVPPWSPSRVSTTIILLLRKYVRHTSVNPKSV